MGTRPLLIFPQPQESPRLKRPGGPSNIHFPSHRNQTARLGPRFQELQQAFEAERAELRLHPGAQPERVLVLEIIGQIEDFIKAVRRIEGMEWLGEWEQDGLEPDDDFYIEDDRNKPLNAKLYLIMSNQRAMEELVRLWQRYRRNPAERFERGLNKWRNVFHSLKEIRFWDERDRLSPGLIQMWHEQLENEREFLPFEIELWFSSAEQKRATDQALVELLIQEEGGRVLERVVLPQIAFHAIAGQIPANSARQMINFANVRLLRCNQVMFFRPLGQSAVPIPEGRPMPGPDRPLPARPERREPVVALLDGLPLVNHQLLQGRLILDDPDGWSEGYLAADRVHGTMMSSLIAHGELDDNEQPLATPIYARPILKARRDAWRPFPVEMIPEETIPEDLIHRAVRRLFDGPGAAAPSVKVVVLAIGDPLEFFERAPTPLARLIDWLSWHYKTLFVLSAGNHTQDIELAEARGRLRHLSAQELERATVVAIESDAINRRLLSPAEAINALTIAAAHADSSRPDALGRRIDPFTSPLLPSPINSIGLGYRRAVKPDLLFPGGRQLFSEKLGNIHANETLQVLRGTTRPPGQRAAAPGGAGENSANRYYCGTSNATAFAARRTAQVYEVLRGLQQGAEGALLQDRFSAVLLKAMLVHASSWDGPIAVMRPILQSLAGRPPWREHLARFLGYGVCNYERVTSCTDERATLLGCGELTDGLAHVYRIPLPPSLSGSRVWRRVTITLAWLTPIDPLDRYYRRAALWTVPPDEQLRVMRCQPEAKMTQRGTVQHEILEGNEATAFLDGDALTLQVNCRAQSGTLQEQIPYALAVTLEVAPETGIPIYQEVRDRLRVGVRVQPNNPARR